MYFAPVPLNQKGRTTTESQNTTSDIFCCLFLIITCSKLDSNMYNLQSNNISSYGTKPKMSIFKKLYTPNIPVSVLCWHCMCSKKVGRGTTTEVGYKSFHQMLHRKPWPIDRWVVSPWIHREDPGSDPSKFVGRGRFGQISLMNPGGNWTNSLKTESCNFAFCG